MLLPATEPWAVYAYLASSTTPAGGVLKQALQPGSVRLLSYRQLPFCSTYVCPVTGLPRYRPVTLAAPS